MPRKLTPRPCACGCGSMTKYGPALRGHQLRIHHPSLDTTLAERYWPKVDTATVCWGWAGSRTKDGYGQIVNDDLPRRKVYAHHVAWWLATGHWPVKGEFVCHDCPGGDDPSCVRNDEIGIYVLDGVSYEKRGHLWLGTQAANNRDIWKKGRSNWQNGQMPDTRGERNVNARLDAETVLELQRLYAEGGYTFEALGILFNLATSTVHRAIIGQTWAHL